MKGNETPQTGNPVNGAFAGSSPAIRTNISKANEGQPEFCTDFAQNPPRPADRRVKFPVTIQEFQPLPPLPSHCRKAPDQMKAKPKKNQWLEGLSEMLDSREKCAGSDPLAEFFKFKVDCAKSGVNPWTAGLEKLPAPTANQKSGARKKTRGRKASTGPIGKPGEPLKAATGRPTPDNPSPEYFDIAGAAGYAKKTERTIRNWIRDGWLKAEKGTSGRKIRIAKCELDKCVKRQ